VPRPPIAVALALALGVVALFEHAAPCDDRSATPDPSFSDDLRVAFGEGICDGKDCALDLSALWCDGAVCTATDVHDGRQLRAGGAPAQRIAQDLHDPIDSERDDPGRVALWRVTCTGRPQHTAGVGWAAAGVCSIEIKAGDRVVADELGEFFEHSLGRHDDTPELRVVCTGANRHIGRRSVASSGFARVISVRSGSGASARVRCSMSDGHMLGDQALEITRCEVSPERAASRH
jgi:hypothetical protein